MSTHHHNTLAGKHIAVVGGGLAGLAAAKVLADGGASIEVIESSDRLGGRVASDLAGGFTVDRGFQIFLSAYPEAQRFLDALERVWSLSPCACQVGVCPLQR